MVESCLGNCSFFFFLILFSHISAHNGNLYPMTVRCLKLNHQTLFSNQLMKMNKKLYLGWAFFVLSDAASELLVLALVLIHMDNRDGILPP